MVSCRVTTTENTPTIGVRAVVRFDEMESFFKEAYSHLSEVISDVGLEVTGPPFGRYRGVPGDTTDVEAGVPIVARPSHVHPAGVVWGAFPAVEVVEAIHLGSYDSLSDTYGEMVLWMHARGLNPIDDMRDVYLTDPSVEPDVSKWQTKVVWPFS